jgi:hypothetical protein
MRLLAWLLLFLGLLLSLMSLGPVLVLLLALLSLPLFFLFVLLSSPLLALLSLVVLLGALLGIAAYLIGLALQWALPLVLVLLGIWILARESRKRLPT